MQVTFDPHPSVPVRFSETCMNCTNPSIKGEIALSRKKMDPHKMVPPGPNTLKYLDPPVRLLQNNTEVLGPPSPNTSKYVLKYLDPL